VSSYFFPSPSQVGRLYLLHSSGTAHIGDPEDEIATHGEAQTALRFHQRRRHVRRGGAPGHGALGAGYLHIHARAPLPLPAIRHPPVSRPPGSNPDTAFRADRSESCLFYEFFLLRGWLGIRFESCVRDLFVTNLPISPMRG
jgi:hypothetical protein